MNKWSRGLTRLQLSFHSSEATLRVLSKELTEKNSYVEKIENHVARKDKRILRTKINNQIYSDRAECFLREVN